MLPAAEPAQSGDQLRGVFDPVFADAGVAWTGGEKASFLGGDRSLLTSVGAALRANVFGFLVAQISAAKPLDRPGRKEWVWQWSLSPGF